MLGFYLRLDYTAFEANSYVVCICVCMYMCVHIYCIYICKNIGLSRKRLFMNGFPARFILKPADLFIFT